MRPVEIIRKKRDGLRLATSDIEEFVRGVLDRSWTEYQASALLMAIYLRGMEPEETADLTRAMVHSGQKLDLSDVPGPKVDKHSTGGVGDKTSLLVAPLAAACGVIVPMMSGRGLGHTGGTLDKLESIPGFRTGLSLDEFRAVLRDVGCSLIGPTEEIAPADRILYALRDVTGTVESIPLITSSILSKKIASGIEALVLDVKCGRGAFMKDRPSARSLAKSLVINGTANGVRTEALLTEMNAPLGHAVGNALEVKECLDILRGKSAARDLIELSLTLAERMVGLARIDQPRQKVEDALHSGAALEKFRQIIARQGGDPRIVDDPSLLPTAPRQHLLRADRDSYLVRVDALLFGEACMRLGAGRSRVEDTVDPSVGAVLHVQPGTALKAGDVVAEIHFRDQAHLGPALEKFQAAFGLAVGDNPTLPYRPLILETVN